jgi:hypothetical protein
VDRFIRLYNVEVTILYIYIYIYIYKYGDYERKYSSISIGMVWQNLHTWAEGLMWFKNVVVIIF